MQYFIDNDLVADDPSEIARFIHHTAALSRSQVRRYLQRRPDVVARVMEFQNYAREFLPNALRKCFAKLEAPPDRGTYLQDLLDSFSRRFCQCNPDLGYSVGKPRKTCESKLFPVRIFMFC